MDEVLSGRLGRYALLGRVGRGGMGEVHRARAFGAAGVTKELCIKRIRCERLADPASLGRFVAEARVSMRLSHANIVSVFDFGRSENDYYLAMEWVDGCDLRQMIAAVEARGERLPEDVALFVAAEIARGLAYVHGLPDERRLAHCDLKPANVLVSRAGEVKLADFGVAVHEASTGGAGGTRRYMAPEQRSGVSVGPAVDLYALGLVLDELLGGRFNERPIPDDAAAGDDYVAPADVSPSLGALLLRLCAREPEARPANAGEVVDALEALLAEARVRSKRSPRDLLAREASALASAAKGAATESVEEFRTDASYVTEGESETFARRMRPDASPRSQSRTTPLPPAPPPSRSPGRVVAIGAAIALGLFLFSLPRRPVPAPVALEATGAPAASAAPVVDRGRAPASVPAVGPALVPVAAPGVASASRHPPRPPSTRLEAPLTPAAAPPAPAPAAPALVRLNARPWADVTIDGEARGVTPLVGVALAPGAHDIVFSNPALDVTRTEHVELAAGERRDVIVDLRSGR